MLHCENALTPRIAARPAYQPRKLAAAVQAVLLACVVMGMPAGAVPSGSGALDEVTLQLKWRHQFQFAGYYAAIAKGYYEEAGLRVNLREATKDELPAVHVLEGRAEFGVGSTDVLLMRAEGEPVVLLASVFQHSALVLLASERSGANNIHALAGKRVTMEMNAVDLLAYLASEGMSVSQLELVPREFGAAPLINGEIDAMSAYLTNEPYLLQEAGVDYFIFMPRASGIDFYGDTLFTTEAQVRRHPERVKRFREASLRGWDYALNNPDEITDLILAEYAPDRSREHLEYEAARTRELIMPDVVEIGYSNPGRWQYIAETYAKHGMLATGISLEGLFYDPDPRPDLNWIYRLTGISFLVSVALFAMLAYVVRLNRRVTRHALMLKQTLDEMKTLKGIIPICSYCHKIRGDEGAWSQLETYISDHSEAEFSHGICDECMAIARREMNVSSARD